MILAVTGATGFVGGHFLDAAHAAGHAVRALTRREQPPRTGVEWVQGDLADAGALARLGDGADALIHVAGAVNARDRAGFARVNVEGTRAVLAASPHVPRFVHVSSIAAREPALSDYGWSKAEADALVRAARPDAVLIRPPAVYGPGDRETLAFFKLARAPVAPVIGGGRFAVIHADDLAAALLAATAAPPGTYEVSDGAPAYAQAEFVRLVAAAMDRRVRIVELPPAVLGPAAALATAAARLTGGKPRLSRDRARYIRHPDWTADPAPLIATGLWRPAVPTPDGLRETAAWYAREGWL